MLLESLLGYGTRVRLQATGDIQFARISTCRAGLIALDFRSSISENEREVELETFGATCRYLLKGQIVANRLRTVIINPSSPLQMAPVLGEVQVLTQTVLGAYKVDDMEFPFEAIAGSSDYMYSESKHAMPAEKVLHLRLTENKNSFKGLATLSQQVNCRTHHTSLLKLTFEERIDRARWASLLS